LALGDRKLVTCHSFAVALGDNSSEAMPLHVPRRLRRCYSWPIRQPAAKHTENLVSKARARHILVDSEESCESLKTQIEGGADFAVVAREHSTCPSGARGGDLGEFSPGMMVPEFDKVVFSCAVGEVQGPVQTQFGYHLIEVTARED
jgi:peptidyl-prolyl cis-trans isomerase C